MGAVGVVGGVTGSTAVTKDILEKNVAKDDYLERIVIQSNHDGDRQSAGPYSLFCIVHI